MILAAPGRLSMTKFCPRLLDSGCAMTRPMMAEPASGDPGSAIRTTDVGHGFAPTVCACATVWVGQTQDAAHATRTFHAVLRGDFAIKCFPDASIKMRAMVRG